MLQEGMFFGAILTIVIVVYVCCPKQLQRHLRKWLMAAMVMPLLVLLFRSSFGGLVLFFWPGSIVLMSLGANERPWTDNLYVWGCGVILNLALYLVLGLISSLMIRDFKKEK